jgi:hypothetical protein
MFFMAQELGWLSCFRCGEDIETVEDFSVDHKKPWFDKDTKLFWSIRNISFSHLSCNASHGRRQQGPQVPHGTHTMYSNHGCRCARCTRAQRDYQRKFYKKQKMRE